MVEIVEKRPADYARHRGISRVAVGKAIKAGRLGGAVRTDAAGVKWIDVAAADLAWPNSFVRVNSPAPLGAPTSSPSLVGDNAAADAVKETPGLTKARTEAAQIDTRLKRLQLDKQLGQLLDAADVGRAMERCAELLVRDVDQLHARTDDVVTAYNRNGVAGVRLILKEISRAMRETIAGNMRLLAAAGDDADDADASGDQVAEQTEHADA